MGGVKWGGGGKMLDFRHQTSDIRFEMGDLR